MNKKKIFFLVPYPLHEAPSQRFRFEQYFQTLKAAGHHFVVQSFLTVHNWRAFYSSGGVFQKTSALLFGFSKRVFNLIQLLPFDFIFIHREVAPIGPPLFEWIISRILQKKIIYDFDDAIWMTDKLDEPWLEKNLRWRSKVANICRWSYKVSAGNAYLANYARLYCQKVVVNPTTVDTENAHRPESGNVKSDNRIVVGWTGSHSTLKYLKGIEHVLRVIEAKYHNVDFWVIANRPPELKLERLVFKPWSVEMEISDLSQFDIGIMPLPDDEWSKGKCGFKALQYMAMEIPTIASAVGVNTTIVQHGVNGYLVKDLKEWESLLATLIEDHALRKKLGREGRRTVELRFSMSSNRDTFLSLFEA